MRWRGVWVLPALIAVPAALAAEDGFTYQHEKGRCAMRGQCGKDGFFGGELPCPDNGLAKEPASDAVREKLVEVCGDGYTEGPVCCLEEQLDVMKENFQRSDGFFKSCPACRDNFVKLFCSFTCSPDQSTFVNVTQIKPKGDKALVTELDTLISDKFGAGLFDSCKEVKFGAANSKAMTVFGNPKNFEAFLAFLGQKRPLFGSPFQINFPRPADGDFPGMDAMNKPFYPCNTTDERYKCRCVDCPGSCLALPAIKEANSCHVGVLPCLSFAVIIVYSVFLILLVVAVSGHVAYQKHHKFKNERLRLLQDAAQSDDEDEGDVIHNAGMLDRPLRQYRLNEVLDKAFSKLGYTCARVPGIVIGISSLVVVFLSLGWINFVVETDPVRLWVAPDSAAAQEKAFFDNNFGPFFRAEQAFLVNDTNGLGPVLSYDTLRWWIDEVEGNVKKIATSDGVTLDDVCYKPTGDACVIQSVSGWLGEDFSSSDWADQIELCADQPGDVSCLPPSRAPLSPKLLLGGWEDEPLNANAMVVTWVVKNYKEGTEEEKRAAAWEEELEKLLLNVRDAASSKGLRLSFNTEISLEEELNKSTNTDAKIVVVSYIIMFLYASLALGSTTLTAKSVLREPAVALIQSKFMLGIVGIVIVLMSVSASVGLFSAVGIKVTLIIAEVIPFLVLAVGVDNIFLIVHEFERVNLSHPDKTVSQRMAKTLGRMGPSILLSALTETVAFALGAAVGMPAVRNFAAYAAGAVLINAILQVTMFISVLALNQRRVEAGRADCFPCVKVSHSSSVGFGMYGMEDEGGLQRFIRKTYAPALLGKKAKVGIITVFLGLFAAGLALLPAVSLGLDQRIAIPTGSYLIDYFNDLDHYLGVGPPVYFVTRDLNATARHPQQELCGKFATCEDDSLTTVLEQESKRAGQSYIADPTASWIDDFFQWLDPDSGCCVEKNGKACFAGRDPPYDLTLKSMPEGEEFIHYLQRWLNAMPGEECPVAGKAAYGDGVIIDNDHITIKASHFRTSHTPLHTQKDFISAYASARRIATDLKERHPGADIFPYSKFYIFFDQYVTIVKLSATLLGSAIAIILLLTTILLGSLRTGLVVTAVVAMTLIDIIGSLAFLGVSLNAISLVNLIICVGISLEFCAHIARAFQFPSTLVLDRAPRHSLRGKDARAWTALVNVGASVFSGITITKFLGVAVLAFTRSKIFEIYYFRVWLSLVILASTHALVLLPVALSIFGGRGYVDTESDGGLEQDLRSRRYPALLGDEDYDSDD